MDGIASDLLQAGTNRSGWPKSARALAGRLRRAQPFLRTLGIEIVFGREGRFTILRPDWNRRFSCADLLTMLTQTKLP